EGPRLLSLPLRLPLPLKVQSSKFKVQQFLKKNHPPPNYPNPPNPPSSSQHPAVPIPGIYISKSPCPTPSTSASSISSTAPVPPLSLKTNSSPTAAPVPAFRTFTNNLISAIHSLPAPPSSNGPSSKNALSTTKSPGFTSNKMKSPISSAISALHAT